MAMSAFRSTSKRGTSNNPSASSNTEKRDHLYTSPNKGNPQQQQQLLRRSRSVSAVSRSQLHNSSPASASPSSDFLLTTRENPLYWTSSSPPSHDKPKDSNITTTNNNDDDDDSKIVPNNASRGRSAARNADVLKSVSGGRKEIGRSLSRVDTGRRNRSVSRGPASRGKSVNSESEAEQEGSFLTKYRSRDGSNTAVNVERKSNVAGISSNRLGVRKQPDGSAAKSSSSPASLGDGVLARSSCSEAEEKTIKAVCEQMKSFDGDNFGSDTNHIYETVRSEVRRAIADIQNDLENAIRRSNIAAITTTNVTDIPPDLVSPSAVELVLDIRREYANKLEQSHERARKLRADLAVEEHRGLELGRILKDVLPDPKTSNVQKSRPGRKSSIERRRMSKRLTDEAMAYFDECVSLSTFDSSDFSSQDDPPINIVGINAPASGHPTFSQPSCSNGAHHSPNTHLNVKQELDRCNHDASEPASSGSNDPSPDEVGLNTFEAQWDRKFWFSFSQKANSTFEPQVDVKKYVSGIEKVHSNSQSLRSNGYSPDEYALQAPSQSLLFDRVFFKNRIESGSMLVCGGSGTAISLSHFYSVI